MSVLSANPLQHWLDTPLGSYMGYPTYGNVMYELLFKNKQALKGVITMILAKITYDLGEQIASTIASVDIAIDGNNNDVFYIILVQKNNNLAIGEYNVA